jgi:drug/metabolite transporter (DMT)-like permease
VRNEQERGRPLRTPETEAYALGMIAVIIFSLTVPMTRLAVPDFGATIVGFGRGFIAAMIAVAVLAIRREPLPPRRYWPVFLRIGLAVFIGFPILISIALEHLNGAHGAVVTGIQPAGTAVFAALRAKERPPKPFWFAVLFGMASVLIFASIQGAGRPQIWDLILIAAMVCSTFGHVEAAKVAREIGGWRVISWTLVTVAPISAVLAGTALARDGMHGDWSAWLAFGELSIFTAYVAFFPWYRALTLGGIAKIGQLQLIQPIFSLIFTALILHETIDRWTVLASIAVIGSVALTRRAWKPAAPVTAEPVARTA